MEHYETAPAPQFGMTDYYAEVVDSWLNLDEPDTLCSAGSQTLEFMDQEVVEVNGPKQGSSSRGTGAMWELVPEESSTAGRDAASVAAELAQGDAFAAAELTRANRNGTSFNLCGTMAEDAHMEPTTPEFYYSASGVSSIFPPSMVNIVRGYRPTPESSPSHGFDAISAQEFYPPEREHSALNFSVSDEAEDMHGDPMNALWSHIKEKELTGGCQISGVKGSSWIKFHMDLLGMAPTTERKSAVASMDGNTEVAIEELLDIEKLMVRLQGQIEGICYSDLMSLSFEGGLKSKQQDRRTLLNRILANKKDDVNIISEITLLKLRNIIPRQNAEVTEVAIDELLDIEQLMVKIKVQMDKICSEDVMSNLCFEGELESEQQHDMKMQILVTKQDNVKIINEIALLKLRNIIPRLETCVEDVRSNLSLKRSRPLSPLHVPRCFLGLTSSLDGKVGVWGPEVSGSPLVRQSTTFEIPNPALEDMLPIKFTRTGDDFKATLQKLSSILMPTAKLGDDGLPILNAPVVPQALTDFSPAAVGGTHPTPPSSLNSNTPHEAKDVEREARSAVKKPRVERKWLDEQAREVLLEEKELERRPHLDELEEHEKRQIPEEQEKAYFREEIGEAWTTFASDLTTRITKKIQDLELASGRDKVGKLAESAGEILRKAGPIKVGKTLGDAGFNSTTLLTVTDAAQLLSGVFKQLQSKVNELVPSGDEQFSILEAMSQLIEEGCRVVIKLGLATEWISKRLHRLVTDLKFRERVVERHFQNCATSISALVPSFLEEQRTNFRLVASVCS